MDCQSYQILGSNCMWCFKKHQSKLEKSTHGWCDRLPIVVSAPKLNSGGVLTSSKVFTRIISKESMSCKCRKSEAPTFYYVEGVSFKNKVFNVGFESLSP
jgi:hypothetical protein